MIIRIEDSNNDMTFGSGELNFYQNSVDGVAQAVRNALLLWSGEWYGNTDLGVPYLESIIGKHSQGTADLQIQDAVLGVTVINQGQSVQAVTSIDNYQSSINTTNRSFSVTMTLNTIYGATALEVSNYAIF